MYDYPIRKNTVIFNNMGLDLKTCDKSHKHYTISHKHGKGIPENSNGNIEMTRYEKYRIPHKLCETIAHEVNKIVDMESEIIQILES